MAEIKKFVGYTTTGKTVYGIIERQVDSYLLNDADGAFAASPADPYVSFTEHTTIKGEYVLLESRAAWNDGLYKATVYEQAGGSPVPASDLVVAFQYMYVRSDFEVVNDEEVSTDIPTLISTAQTDLDTITGSDGVTLATAQAQYAPNKVVPDVAGTVATLQTAIDVSFNTVNTNIADVPTVAEFEARTLLSADYVVTTDTITGVTTATNLTNAPTNGDLTSTMKLSVNTEVDSALSDYDGPTKAETDASFNIVNTNISNLNDVSSSDVTTSCTSSLNTYDAPTKSEMDVSFNTINTNVADVPTVAEFEARSLLAADYVVVGDTIAGVTTATNLTNAPTNGDLTATMKASVNTECDNALADYDGPTKAEADASFNTVNTNILNLNDVSAADVNTQVSDVMKTDTITEMAQGVPSATPTIEDAIMYLYMQWRNEVTQTATTLSLKNDGGTVITKATVSDDTTTFTKGEMVSGP